MRYLLYLTFFTLLGCQGRPDTTTGSDATEDANPPAEGFNAAGSDERAIALADSVVLAHGGRRAYDQARYFEWNFFGVRDLVWDKQQQRVRIDVPEKETIYLLDYSGAAPTGRVRRQGVELTSPDSVALYLQDAMSIFINDSYWLVQPFKLKDSGVTLKYGGEATDPQKNRPSEIIELTFSGVGDTPGNRYQLYVDKDSHRINTWQFYRDAADEEPTMETPYDDYQDYSGLMLSSDRGGRFQLGGIRVPDEVAETTFTQF